MAASGDGGLRAAVLHLSRENFQLNYAVGGTIDQTALSTFFLDLVLENNFELFLAWWLEAAFGGGGGWI